MSEHQSKIKLRSKQIEDAERFVRVFLTEDGGPHAGRCALLGVAFDEAGNARVGILPNIANYQQLGAALVQLGNDIMMGRASFEPTPAHDIEGEVVKPPMTN